MKRICLLILFLLGTILVGGCGSQETSQDGAYQVTDVRGTVVTMKAKPERILTMSFDTDGIVLGLVPPEKMVASSMILEDPDCSNIRHLTKRIEKKIIAPTVEEILSMKPDLVIVSDWGSIEQVENLRDLGLPVVVVKGAKNIDEVKENVMMIAKALGEEEKGVKLVAKMDDKLAEIAQKVAKIPQEERKQVVLLSLMKTYGGIGCTFDDACRYAGVRNGMAEAGIHKGQALTKEMLLSIDPDILFLPSYTNQGQIDVKSYRDQYLNDPALSPMKAIQNHAFAYPREGYLYNCSQDIALAVQEIAYVVYGDEFYLADNEHLSVVEEGE